MGIAVLYLNPFRFVKLRAAIAGCAGERLRPMRSRDVKDVAGT
jgi:hypothetical protein